jgi:hypothetical protein
MSYLEDKQREFFPCLFVPFRPSMNWVRLAHVGKIICFTESTYPNVDLT